MAMGGVFVLIVDSVSMRVTGEVETLMSCLAVKI